MVGERQGSSDLQTGFNSVGMLAVSSKMEATTVKPASRNKLNAPIACIYRPNEGLIDLYFQLLPECYCMRFCIWPQSIV